MFKKHKKGQNICKFGQKCTKFENILKKGRWLHAIITCIELLEKVLACPSSVDKIPIWIYYWLIQSTCLIYTFSLAGN